VQWRLDISAYDFEVLYKPGTQQRVADELSRMVTTEYAVSPSLEYEEGNVPWLVVLTEDNSFPPSPTVPRLAPLIQLTGPLEAISLEELLDAQAGDTLCRDMVSFMDDTAGFRSSLEIRWDRNGPHRC
jgi:hypothetical protein